jgi:hypothetical protein
MKPGRDWVSTREGVSFRPAAWPESPKRALACVARWPYMIVESDKLTKGQFVNILLYLMLAGLKLRAVTDTGNKSLHAIFERPEMPKVAERQNVFGHVDSTNGVDGYMFVKSTGVRFGDLKQKEMKRLLALDDRREADYQRKFKESMREIDRIFAILEGLGCDRMLFRLNATCRLPGCERWDEKKEEYTGQWQQLLYLDPIYTPLASMPVNPLSPTPDAGR